MTENNSAENAGDQDENASAPADLVTPELRPLIDQALERATWDRGAEGMWTCQLLAAGAYHDRHVGGPATAPVHCPGLSRDDQEPLATYADELAAWEAENPWCTKYRPLLHHARVLARKLDRDNDAPASLSSAYLQAITRLERFRPGAPAGDAGDGLTPAGRQPSIFDAMED